MRMLKLVCESLQTTYSLHFLSVESFYCLSLYGVFEQQRLISDFADDRNASFLLEVCTIVSLYAEVGQKNLSNNVDPDQTAHTETL